MNSIIYEASFTGLIRLILVIFIVYTVFSFFFRYILPSIMRKYVNDFQKQYTQQQQDEHKKEGEVSITYVDKEKNRAHNLPDAEEVDFEEIK